MIDELDQDAYDRKVLRLVTEYGMAVQGVLPDGSGDDEPGFSYTVGLAARGLSELIVFGLPPRLAQSLLNDLGGRMLNGRVQVGAGDVVWQLVQDYPVRLIEVTDSREHLTMSNRFYGASVGRVPALQIVFPDAAGRWPWEEENRVSGLPLLGVVPDGPGREVTLPDPGQN